MGKEIPWSFAKIRSGEQLNLKGRGFTNVASLTAAASRRPRTRCHHLPEHWRHRLCAVPRHQRCTNWKQVAIGANAI